MNRNEEYKNLLTELETPNPAVEYTLTRAKARNRRRKWIYTPAAALACAFACFVLLINISAPAAYACSQIPVLRELTELFHFNQSMEAAIDNDYVQQLDLKQTKNGITVSLDYAVLDQKQVNIFYHVTMKNHEELAPNGLQISSVNFSLENGEDAKASIVWSGYLTRLSDIDMRTITVDFVKENVPSVLILKMDICKDRIGEDDFSPVSYDVPLASFDFNIHFDPDFYQTKGKFKEINQDFELNGQKFTLTTAEIYPTYFQFNLESDQNNTLWLKDLEFHLKGENEEKLESKTNGIFSIGNADSPEYLSYRAESPWFYDAENFDLVLTGASWLAKDYEKFQLDLNTGKADGEPDFVTDISLSQEKSGKVIVIYTTPFQSNRMIHFSCYDESDNYFSTRTGFTKSCEKDIPNEYVIYLPKDYDSDILYLSPDQDSEWTGECVLNINVE